MVALSYSLQIYSAGAGPARYTIALKSGRPFGNAIRDIHQSIASETRWQLSSPQSAALAKPFTWVLARAGLAIELQRVCWPGVNRRVDLRSL